MDFDTNVYRILHSFKHRLEISGAEMPMTGDGGILWCLESFENYTTTGMSDSANVLQK